MTARFWVWLLGAVLLVACNLEPRLHGPPGFEDGGVPASGGVAGNSGNAANGSGSAGEAGSRDGTGQAGAFSDACACTTPLHCDSRSCGEDGLCEPTRCFDGVLNGSETDVDCGGPGCAPCRGGAACVSDPDCADGGCRCGRCGAGGAPADVACEPPRGCDDGIQNDDETDVDCGGPACAPCAPAQRCDADQDCESETCRFLLARPLACGDVKACE